MPSSSSESSSSSKGFNGARCFWRLMMISPSFSFERTARRVLSPLFVLFCVLLVGKRTTEKKRASLFDLSFFSWAPFVLLCHFYVERERERERERCKKEAR